MNTRHKARLPHFNRIPPLPSFCPPLNGGLFVETLPPLRLVLAAPDLVGAARGVCRIAPWRDADPVCRWRGAGVYRRADGRCFGATGGGADVGGVVGHAAIYGAGGLFAAVAVITAEPAATPSIVALWLSSLSTITFAIFSSDVVHVTP